MLDHYPSISETEFAQACEALEQRCHDKLDGTNWLSIRWHDQELKIKQMSSKSTSNIVQPTDDEECDEKLIEGDHDEDTIDRTQSTSVSAPHERPAVDFSILLSPTYRVPILWFTLSEKAANTKDLEEIYSRVVAPGSHESLRGIGIMGGISIANHPLTDIPTFFIHPCNTPEAMVALNDGSYLNPFRYLLLWFGVVGAGVGLHVPSKIVA